MVRSFDTIRVERSRPAATESERSTGHSVARSVSQSSGFGMAAIVVLTIFFLATRPSADSVAPTVSDKTAPVAHQVLKIDSPEPRLGPPQLNQGKSLEETVILDQPLATSKAQDGTFGALDVSPKSMAGPPAAADAVTLRLLNGSGKVGMASTQRAVFAAKGFNVVSIGTAVNTYTKSVIYYTPGHQKAAESIRSVYGRSETKLSEDALAQPADILLVIGKDVQ